MLPPLNLPVGTTGAACADDSIEVQRFNPPDTHKVTWVCPADNEKCAAAYKFDRRGRLNATVTLCVSPKPRLLSLVDDRTTIAEYLAEYEQEVLQTDAIEKEVIAACKRMLDYKPYQLFVSSLLKCTLFASSAEEYNGAAQEFEEVVVKETKPYISIAGDRIEQTSTALVPGQKRQIEGVPDADESEPSEFSQSESVTVMTDQEPRVAFKLVGKEVYIQLTNYLGSICLHGSITFRATNQLSLKRASEDTDFLQIMTRFPHYDPFTTVVRDDDDNGQDVPIITFMLWLAQKTNYDGYTHEGCLNLAKDSGGDFRMVAPEVFLMGVHAKQVTDAWIAKHGDFRDRYEVPHKPMPPPPPMETAAEYNKRGKTTPVPFLQRLFPRGNPHLIAWTKALRILKAASEKQQAA